MVAAIAFDYTFGLHSQFVTDRNGCAIQRNDRRHDPSNAGRERTVDQGAGGLGREAAAVMGEGDVPAELEFPVERGRLQGDATDQRVGGPLEEGPPSVS